MNYMQHLSFSDVLKTYFNFSRYIAFLLQAAIKLLQRLEFKNPGRKQIEYGTFNPESSEREKKKLRRFQNSKLVF